MPIGRHPIICAAYLTLSGTLLPNGALAQNAAFSDSSAAKQIAILGVPSKLQALAMLQTLGNEPAPKKITNTLASFPSPSAKPEGMTSQPDIFGSTALRIGHSPLDAKWRLVQAAGAATGQWGRLKHDVGAQENVARIHAINSWVNARIAFSEDRQNWGAEDRWATLSESFVRGRGDCEDYAIAKMQLLRAGGFAAEDLYFIIVKDLVRRADHAVLAVRVDGKFLILDSKTDHVLESQDVSDYRPVFTYSADRIWTHGYKRQVRLTSLGPLEVGAGL